MKYSLAAALVCGASTVSTAEDKARFEATGFMQSLDLFIAEQVSKLRSGEQKDKDEKIKDIDLSLRDTSGANDSGFLYLRDRSAAGMPGSMIIPGDLGDRPDFSSLLAPDGTVRGSYGQDILDTTSRMGISLPTSDNPYAPGIEVSLESSYRMSLQGIPALSGFSSSDTTERNYNIGLTVGYSGFNLDASMMRQESLFDREISGYGVGFSYQASSWMARLSLSEYKEGADLYGIENEARNIISVELGASYRLTDSLGLQGGLRYYDYGSRIMLHPEAGEKSQMVFLGGRLKF
ncbi:porin [Kordiimonas aestuarii]|uniref:porin n=1 Tax=Kordiimonas aestuarii TaxID=1005925 RepID=UPI0021CF583B|nr:porin [Kordiimonas aestuarii]